MKSVVLMGMCKECNSLVYIAPDPFDRDYLWQCENEECFFNNAISLYEFETPSWVEAIDKIDSRQTDK